MPFTFYSLFIYSCHGVRDYIMMDERLGRGGLIFPQWYGRFILAENKGSRVGRWNEWNVYVNKPGCHLLCTLLLHVPKSESIFVSRRFVFYGFI